MKFAANSSTAKKRTLVIAAVLVLAVSAAGTLAYLHAKTAALANTFVPGEVSCAVSETFDGTAKSDVCITNTGDVEAYIRAAVVVTWQDGDGNIYGVAPAAGEYSMTVAAGWTLGDDGFYYWPDAVAPGESTGILISSASETAGKAPDGYHLCIEILGSAIQAEGTDAADEVW